MEPISSTYGSTSTRELFGAARVRQPQESAATDQTKSTDDQASSQQSATSGKDTQLGIQPTSRRTEEFQPYGPDGLQTKDSPREKKNPDASKATPDSPPAAEAAQQDPQTQQTIARLKSTEEKVKAHEAAHKAAGGAATGPISYSYTRGPDGKNYITGGEVPITISTGRTPQETISRMQQVIQAALAPADPSPQDRAVAAQAATIQQTARMEQATSKSEAPSAEAPPPTTDSATPQKDDPNPTSSGVDSMAAQQSYRAYRNPAVTGEDRNAEPAPRRDATVLHPLAQASSKERSARIDGPNPTSTDQTPTRLVSLYR